MQRGRRFRIRTLRRHSRRASSTGDEAEQAIGSQWRDFYRHCLALRRRYIVPWVAELRSGGSFHVEGETLLRLAWTARNGQRLHLIANLASAPCTDVALPAGELVFATDGVPAPGTIGQSPASWRGLHSRPQRVSESLQRLAAAHGIAPQYHDIWGHVHRVEDDTLRALLGAMRVDAGTEDSIATELLDLARARCRQCVPPMTVVRSDARPWRIAVHLAATVASRPLAWRVRSESGIEPRDVVAAPPPDPPDAVDVGGERFLAFALDIDVELPEGYHGVELLSAGQSVARGTLAVAPPTCYRPASLRGGGRRWGAAVQLYGLRSNRNWGIGDFTDLATFVEQWGAEGADVIGVNPLHALFPHNPAQASPYSPSSRMFVNVLYLDVEAIPEFERCAEARERVESREFQAMSLHCGHRRSSITKG